LLAQILAGRGLAAATVAINPAPFRGVLPLPPAAIRSTFPVLRNPANRGRAIALTVDQFRYSWANAVSEQEAQKQRRNPGITEHVELADRGHSLTIDSGWREVCDRSLEFIARNGPR
jgi:hypothetical protein